MGLLCVLLPVDRQLECHDVTRGCAVGLSERRHIGGDASHDARAKHLAEGRIRRAGSQLSIASVSGGSHELLKWE